MDIKQIILHAIYGRISDEDRQELEGWLGEEENRRLYERIQMYLEKRDAVEFLAGLDTEAALQKSRRRLRRPMKMLTAIGSSVAAAVVIGLLVWPMVVTTVSDREPVQGPTITLASGEVLLLDGSEVEHLSESAVIRVSGEKIEVRRGKKQPAVPAFNTLNVPHGESYSIMLSDGTRVWVNAMSSLKFPASFEGGTARTVELSGEGYFEVARDTVHPFRVVTPRQTIIVTGTEFNVTAYADEVNRTTLCSGSVTVETAGGEPIRLRPGQQLSLTATGETTVMEVNADMYTAWRIGEYYFDNQTLCEVFLALGRWYDIRGVDFTDTVTKERLFSGKLKKSDGLETILQVIERGTRSRIGYRDGQVTIGNH